MTGRRGRKGVYDDHDNDEALSANAVATAKRGLTGDEYLVELKRRPRKKKISSEALAVATEKEGLMENAAKKVNDLLRSDKLVKVSWLATLNLPGAKKVTASQRREALDKVALNPGLLEAKPQTRRATFDLRETSLIGDDGIISMLRQGASENIHQLVLDPTSQKLIISVGKSVKADDKVTHTWPFCDVVSIFFYSDAATGVTSSACVSVTFMLLVPVSRKSKLGGVALEPCRIEVLTVRPARRDYELMRNIFNLVAFKSVVRESLLSMSLPPTKRARVAAAMLRALRSRKRTLAFSDVSEPTENSPDDVALMVFSVLPSAGWAVGIPSDVDRNPNLERLGRVIGDTAVGTLTDEFLSMKEVHNAAELAEKIIADTRHAHFQKPLCYPQATQTGWLVAARLPEEHRPKDCDDDDYFSVSLTKGAGPTLSLFVDDPFKRFGEESQRIRISPDNVLLPPYRSSKVAFVCGERVSAVWPGTKVFYNAVVLKATLINSRAVEVRFWTDDGEDQASSEFEVSRDLVVREHYPVNVDATDEDGIVNVVQELVEMTKQAALDDQMFDEEVAQLVAEDEEDEEVLDDVTQEDEDEEDFFG
jgi:hypothetical protein